MLVCLAACSKPDESWKTPDELLFCVDCFDQINHIAYEKYFCGTAMECDRFITEVRTTAREKQMLLVCFKY